MNNKPYMKKERDLMKPRENVQPLRSAEEIKEFRQALNRGRTAARDLLLFDLGINTGLRISDLLPLTVGDVRGKTSVTIQEKKTGKKRTVFLHMIMPEIATYIDGKEEVAYLFASERIGQPISTTQAYRILQKAADWIGREDIGTHTLRKTFGYHYYQQTKDIGTLMVIFNHGSQSVTKCYLGIEEEEIEGSLKNFKL